MFRYARFLLCVILFVTTLSGAPAPAVAQGEVPPPPGGSDSMPAGTDPSDPAAAPIAEPGGPSEVAETRPVLASEEKVSLDTYRQQNPALMAATSDYYSVAGSNFQPRSSSLKINYSGGACIYASGDGGSPDSNAFTAPVNLPDGAVILGVRFYGYDLSASDMSINLFAYDGAGNYTDNLMVISSGTPGFFNTYAALATPITVNNASVATSLVWYPDVISSDLRLCAARIFYFQPFPPVFSGASMENAAAPQDDMQSPEPASLNSFYTFIAGHDFQPRNASTTYSYGGGGCIKSNATDMYVADADLPEGATLLGARLYYYDASTTEGIGLFATLYDGAGNLNDILYLSNGAVSSGYGNTYAALSTPRVIDQYNYAMVVNTYIPADTNVKFCGVKLYWKHNVGYATRFGSSVEQEVGEDTTSAPDSPAFYPDTIQTEYHYRNIAGVTFQPRTVDGVYAYDSGGCIHLTAGTIVTADLQLPAGANLIGVRMFTYDTSPSDSMLFTADYNGSGGFNEFIYGTSNGTGGYGNWYYIPSAPYTVDTAKSMALVWNSGGATDSTMRLCGMRAFYSIPVEIYGAFLPLIQKQ